MLCKNGFTKCHMSGEDQLVYIGIKMDRRSIVYYILLLVLGCTLVHSDDLPVKGEAQQANHRNIKQRINTANTFADDENNSILDTNNERRISKEKEPFYSIAKKREPQMEIYLNETEMKISENEAIADETNTTREYENSIPLASDNALRSTMMYNYSAMNLTDFIQGLFDYTLIPMNPDDTRSGSLPENTNSVNEEEIGTKIFESNPSTSVTAVDASSELFLPIGNSGKVQSDSQANEENENEEEENKDQEEEDQEKGKTTEESVFSSQKSTVTEADTSTTTLSSITIDDNTTRGKDTVEEQLDLWVPVCCDGNRDIWLGNHSLKLPPLHLPISFGVCEESDEHSLHSYDTPQYCAKNYYIIEVDQSDYRYMKHIHGKLYLIWEQILIHEFCFKEDVERNRSDISVALCGSRSHVTDVQHCSSERHCKKKCCKDGYALQKGKCVCQNEWSLMSFKSFHRRILDQVLDQEEERDLQIQVGLPNCPNPETITKPSQSENYNFEFSEDGRVSIKYASPSLDYCVGEYFQDETQPKTKGSRALVLLCPVGSKWEMVRQFLIYLGLLVSCVFLTATLLCHVSVPALRDHHGLCLAAYAAALLVADSALFTREIFSEFLSPSVCFAVGIVMYGSFLSTFFWLNVVCFDVWKYVRSAVQAIPMYHSKEDLTRFFYYGVYAWGSPLVIVIVTVILQLLPEHIQGFMKPNFSENSCWFKDGAENLVYFYGPMGFLCLVNTILIVHTALRLYCVDRRCHCFFSSCRRTDHTLHHQHVAEFWQRFALFAFTATCWVTEVVSWCVRKTNMPPELWAFTDIFNSFQGIFIFFTFIRSTKRRRLVRQWLKQWSDRIANFHPVLTVPHIPTTATPSYMTDRIKCSALWKALVRFFSIFCCCTKKPQLSSQEVLDNIIFKQNAEHSDGYDNKAYEDDNLKTPETLKSGKLFGEEKSLNPIWTIPYWKAPWSRTFIPNAANNEGKLGSEMHSDDLICENFTDTLSIYSTQDQGSTSDYTTLEKTNSQRPTLTNWNLLRLKSGSLSLVSKEEGNQISSEVVCQGLKWKNSCGEK